MYYLSWDKMLGYFMTLEDKDKRRRIIQYFERGSKEEALFITIANWFNYKVKWFN